MKSLKYFFQFLIISIFFLIFKLLGHKLSINISCIIFKYIGPFFRSKKMIESNEPILIVFYSDSFEFSKI